LGTGQAGTGWVGPRGDGSDGYRSDREGSVRVRRAETGRWGMGWVGPDGSVTMALLGRDVSVRDGLVGNGSVGDGSVRDR
jgi:hypothetical protein